MDNLKILRVFDNNNDNNNDYNNNNDKFYNIDYKRFNNNNNNDDDNYKTIICYVPNIKAIFKRLKRTCTGVF